MTFELHRQRRPKSNNSYLSVSAYFRKKHNDPNEYLLHIHIGKGIAKMIGTIENEFQIEFYIDSVNPRLWMIKPATDKSMFFYKPTLFFNNYHLKISWYKFVPNEEDMKKNLVYFKIQDDYSIIIDFNKKIT